MSSYPSAFVDFVRHSQHQIHALFDERFPGIRKPILAVEPCGEFHRIAWGRPASPGGMGLWAFVHKTTGDIFEPSTSWHVPSDKLRGNIFRPDWSRESVDAAGAVFDAALDEYVKAEQSAIVEQAVRLGALDHCPVLTVERGPRYARIVRNDNGTARSVRRMVDLANGDILKPNGWRGPAKGVRGNIFELARRAKKNNEGP